MALRGTRPVMAMLNGQMRRPTSFFQRDYKNSTAIVAVSWFAILFAGVGGFIVVRDKVIDRRKEIIRKTRATAPVKPDLSPFQDMVVRPSGPVNMHKPGTLTDSSILKRRLKQSK